jgi:DNA repair exonuclease SbcCD nuclease subunit
MKFVHAADLHLDSPLRGLGAYDGAPVERVREATRRAFHNLIDLCLRESAAFLILAGDVFDGDWKDFSTGLFFVKELERLREAGTRAFLVRGNHDAASEVTRQLRLPPHVHEFSEDAAETVHLEAHGVALHGLSFSHRAMPESLVPRYPAPVADLFNVGVLHTSADGRPGHHPYAPCRLEELVDKGYDYWALGHVHAHEILCERPYVVFPGNTQGRHIKETGKKGAMVVTVDGRQIRAARHEPVDVLRWRLCELELDENDGLEALYFRARAALEAAREESDGRLTAVRLVVGGRAEAHAAIVADPAKVTSELRALSFEWRDDLWLEEVRLAVRPPLLLDELKRSEGFVGELLRSVESARGDATQLAELAEALRPLRERLGEELRRADLDLADPALVRELLSDAEALLAARLTEARR